MQVVTNEDFIKAYGDINTPTKLLTPEQKDNRNIIYSVINKYRKHFEKDELLSISLNAVWKALASHVDGKGNKFTTSLWRFVDWECKRQYRNKKKKKNVIHTVNIENIEIEEKPRALHKSHIEEKLEELSEFDRKILTEYYIEGYTMEEIGKRNGYSKEAARQKIKKALTRLEQRCNKLLQT